MRNCTDSSGDNNNGAAIANSSSTSSNLHSAGGGGGGGGRGEPMNEYVYQMLLTQGSSLTTLPFWYWAFGKSMLQRSEVLCAGQVNDMNHLSQDKKKLGWRLYWKGLTGVLCFQVLFPYTEFAMTKGLELSDRLFGGDSSDPTDHKERPYRPIKAYPISHQAAVAALTGASVTVLTNPIETLQVNSQKTLKPMWKEVLPELIRGPQPIRRFYRGAFPMAIRNGTFATSLFVGVPYFDQKIRECYPDANPLLARVLGSIMAGTLANIINSPIDISMILRQRDPSATQFQSSIATLKTGYHKHGPRLFLAGFGFKVLASAIELTGFHSFRQWYSEKFPYHSPETAE